MSLLEFPPVDDIDDPYCIQELNGRLIYGSKEEVESTSDSDILKKYPVINKDRLHCLEHALSRENVRRVFSDVQSSKLSQAYEIWQRNGAKGVWDYVTNVSENTRFGWPVAKVGNAVRQAGESFKKVFTQTEENAQEIISKNTDVLDWRFNWVRCMACSPDGERLAVCQSNDYIRIYMCDGHRKPAVTLKHSSQKDVADMAWKPFDQFALAVACNAFIIVWRFGQQKLANRIPTHCAQVIDFPSAYCPATQCIWDKTLSATLLVASPSSSQILIMDTVSGENQSVGSWFGNRIKRVIVSPDGSKILVSYRAKFIRVYDRDTWKDESWSKLKGECAAAVWSPDSSFFFFSCDEEPMIRAIRFTTRMEISADGERLQRWYGVSGSFPIFDVTAIEQGLIDDCESRLIGGVVQDMQLSGDGQRLAVTFKSNCSNIALFIVDDKPKIRLTPCGLIEGRSFGDASLLRFFPNFTYGSLLVVIWTGGKMQYIPLLYGTTAEADSRAIRLFLSSTEPKSKTLDDDVHLNEPSFSSGQPSSSSEPLPATLETEEPELFTTAGLFDQLISKSLLEQKNT